MTIPKSGPLNQMSVEAHQLPLLDGHLCGHSRRWVQEGLRCVPAAQAYSLR